ncbi:MAG: glycosyltransferase N-terminal domain-containing protein, partial [Pseudomonadota bacterium]|nr:glycosyltransferase N-terminal domain-containing protein [Pseudomonadota bacterium]
MLSLYRLATIIGYPFIELYFRSRLVNGKEDLIRFPERKGITIKARPAGPILWFHAASVGESLSLLPLISSLLTRHGNINILVTTGTVSSASVMAERLPQRAF